MTPFISAAMSREGKREANNNTTAVKATTRYLAIDAFSISL
jgi:hypothetical protein